MARARMKSTRRRRNRFSQLSAPEVVDARGLLTCSRVLQREGPEQDHDLGRAREMFEASAKGGHPAIMRYHDHGLCKKFLIIPDRAELLMELVEEKSLDQL